ncbi:MAG: L-fucose/L-arabinose isomerase family protein [Candidatus Izemoplasmataceae bacterium]
MKINVGLMAIGFEKFRVDLAKRNLKRSMELLREEPLNLVHYDEVVMDVKTLNHALTSMQSDTLDLMVVQVGTFPMGELALEMLTAIKDVPLFIWALEDPVTEDYNTVPLNAFTGLNMLSSYCKRLGITFAYDYGDLEDKRSIKKLRTTVQALKAKKLLKHSKFGVIGTRAPGFYLSEVNQLAFKRHVGPSIEYYAIGELVQAAKAFEEEDVKPLRDELSSKINLKKGSEDQLDKTVRVYLAIRDLVERENITALSIKCWPEWQSLYGISVCPILSLLNDEGYITSCEGDVGGLATMVMQYAMTDEPPFLADLPTISKERVKAWHCGHTPMKLCDGPIAFIEHPTMKEGIGLAVQGEMKTSEAITIAKLSEMNEHYRLFLSKGKSVPVDRQLEGPQTDLVLDKSTTEIVDTIVENGIEHHYSIAHQDIADALRELSKWMGWTVIE